MGAGGSLPNNQEPPPLPPPFYNGNPSQSADISRMMSGSLSESQRDERASGTSTLTRLGNPGSQHARCSGSMKNEEWWDHRPSAPCLSDLRSRRQETTLTYAGEMTGGQSGRESDLPPATPTSMHQEAIELSRAVSHLAAANEQLATAHKTVLGQLEAIYRELNRERELRYEREREERKAIAREPVLLRDRKLRGKTSHEETSTAFNDAASADESFEEQLEIRLGVARNNTKRSLKRENLDSTEKINKNYNYHVDIDSPRYSHPISEERRRFFETGANNTRSSSKENENGGSSVEEYENNDGTRLLEEIERLKNERLEYRERNYQLTNDLDNRVILMEKLTRDYQFSRSQYENVETRLNERQEQFDALVINYENARVEKSRLSKELEMSNFARDTANLRIADLERELATSNNENQENSRLRKIFSDETTSIGKERASGLEEALKEIQRLNEVIENGGRNKEEEENEEEDEDEEEGARGGTEITENESNSEQCKLLDTEISVARSNNMEEFRKELSLKREARQRAIAAVSSEMDRLRRELDAEKEAHSETSRILDLLKSGQATNVANEDSFPNDKNYWERNPDLNSNEADAQALADIIKVSDELKSSIRLQTEKIDNLRYHLECEPEGHKNRIASLKDIATMSRESSGMRERQINKLKNLLAQILARLGDPRFRVEITDDVRSEHDRQLEDISRLKSLYDDRLRVLADLRDSATKELTDLKDKLKSSQKQNCGLEEELKTAEEKIDNQDTEISNLESQLGLTKADCRDLQNQMSVINGLFTQMLLSASSADMDLDRLTRLLQENHDLISDMAREEGTEAAALPKLLLDIVEQVEGRGDGESDIKNKEDDPQEENIAHNLPKVWRVLLELLSCHAAGSPSVTPAASLSTDPNSCYKSVDTPSGPRLVISVSKTYIRLKELILEKKHLEKEMNRMKTLNTHLESKLGEQEKRLSTVSSELSKTWNIVGRMQAQHQQLHTHEKILRYELQQKRKMLQELKQELEYCREKWESARQKNTNTEIEWRSLRREFAARKSHAAQDSFNNSGESGFSDERGDDSDEDATIGESRPRIGPRRRARKENPRAASPDTESEQPTDTELSETKTTPETNVSTEDVSIASGTEKLSTTDESIPLDHQPIDPLDQALTNVIKNLITVDESETGIDDFPSTACSAQPTVDEEDSVFHEQQQQEDEDEDSSRSSETQVDDRASSSTCTVSVFSIGPFPSTCSTPPPAKSVQFSDPLIVGPSTQSAPGVSSDAVQDTENLIERTKNDDQLVEDSIERGTTMLEVDKEANPEIPCVGFVNPDESTASCHKELPQVLPCLMEDIATPSTSVAENSLQSSSSKPVVQMSPEEVLAARAARLKRLEEQADWLMKKMNATNRRGSALSTRLEELHQVYAEAPAPPPMPDVLPNLRIPLESTNRQKNDESSKKGPDETPQAHSS